MTDLPLQRLVSLKIGHFRELRVEHFPIFPEVYSLKKKIVSVAVLIIDNHARVLAWARLWLRACVLGSRLLYLHVWSEHLSSPSRRCETVSRQVPPTLRERDRGERIHAFKPLLLSNYLHLGGNKHTCRDASRQIHFCIFFLCIFPSFILSHTNSVECSTRKPEKNILLG